MKKACEHGRQRSKCKDCGGARICAHGRIRSQCKECKQSTGWKRKAAEVLCQPADCPLVPDQESKSLEGGQFDESLSAAQPKKARQAQVPMCLPTLEHDDNDQLVIDGFVVRCGATRLELDGL